MSGAFALVGSLPYKSIEETMRFNQRFENNPLGVVTFPELSNLGDGMIQCFEYPEKLSCLDVFKEQKYSRVKIQGPGPASLIMLQQFRRYSEDDLVELAENYLKTIRKGLNAEEIIISLDEPGMQTAPVGSQNLWEPIFSAFGNNEKREVHICGDSGPWSDILQFEWLDYLNFDASIVDITIYKKEYAQFRENGGHIAWGIKKESDIKDWRLGDLVTPVCGLYKHSALECEIIFNMLNFIAQKKNWEVR
jgi:hypothetical protein